MRHAFLLTLVMLLAHSAFGWNPEGAKDAPFDLTKVLFSATFTDHMVLQREPQHAAVFGTATPGALITVALTGPNSYIYEVSLGGSHYWQLKPLALLDALLMPSPPLS